VRGSERHYNVTCSAVAMQRPRDGQRLGKHVPIARQRVLNNATVGTQQWKRCVFYVVRAERL
jgi:hypothetical protein